MKLEGYKLGVNKLKGRSPAVREDMYIFKGEWDSAVSYKKGDFIWVDNSGTDETYQALQDGTNKDPTTETDYWEYLYDGKHKFSCTEDTAVKCLIVAEGGHGGIGSRGGAGGGAGGLVLATMVLSPGDYTAVVGSGSAYQANGNDSSFNGLTAKGGGYGVGYSGEAPVNGVDGGSGSGGGNGGSAGTSTGGSETQTTQVAVYGYGNDGGGGNGSGTEDEKNAGGGGGAGEEGGDGTSEVKGDGGDGLDLSDDFGTDVGDSGWFAGGGGAGTSGYSSLTAGSGGNGGGGDGAQDGTPNTGGGGGGYDTNDSANRKIGGSGIVIVKTFKGYNLVKDYFA